MMPQRSFYDSEGEPVEQKTFVPIDEFPDNRDNPEEALITKETEIRASEEEDGPDTQDHWALDQRDADFIPPSETGYTLHDFQMVAATNQADRIAERKKLETLTREERVSIIEAELDRMLVERKLRELRGDSAFDSLQESDGHRGAEPVNKHWKGADTIRRAA